MNKIDELKKLKGLLDNGLVSQEEFNSLKSEILGDANTKVIEDVESKIKERQDKNDKIYKAKAEAEKAKLKERTAEKIKKSPEIEKTIVKEVSEEKVEIADKTTKKESNLKCKKCSTQISKYIDESNKGVCIECKEKSFQIPKWAYLFLLLLIPLAWWIISITSVEEPKLKEPIVIQTDIESITDIYTTEEKVSESDLSEFGYIKGIDIIIRQTPNSSSKILGSFKNSGEKVSILEQFIDESESQVLLNRDLNIQIDGKNVLIKKGKALKIITKNNDTIYIVQYEIPNEDYSRRLMLHKDNFDFSKNNWYKIKRDSGELGWVFWKFILFDDSSIDESTEIEETEIEETELNIENKEPNKLDLIDKNDWGGGFRFKERLNTGYYDKFPKIMLGRYLGANNSYDRKYYLFEDKDGAKIEFEDGGRNFENYTNNKDVLGRNQDLRGSLFIFVWRYKNNKPYIDRIFLTGNDERFEYAKQRLLTHGSGAHGTSVYNAEGNSVFYKNTDNLCSINGGLVEKIISVSSPNATTSKISSKSKTNMYGETWNIRSNSDTVILNIEMETISNLTITRKIELHFKDK